MEGKRVMDLNELPVEAYDIFEDVVETRNPMFCTQFLAVISSPDESYVGKMFDTIKEARLCYNEYARRKGFSIRTGTSRRSAITMELGKVLFVCNKEGKGKKSKGVDEEITEVDDVELGTSQSSGSDLDEPKGRKEKCIDIKRKREKMKYTSCRARMLIKFNGNKWFVKQFIADHNRSLVDKPSLAKFLRSHAGIPKEEVEFLKLLHDCNLETSRMMQLMSELYGSAHSVPYHEKHIRHLWVPSYFLDRFYPFLQSTQRSESFNAVLKKYVNPHNSILDFVHQYKKIQDKTDVAEDKQDYRTDQKLPLPWSRWIPQENATSVTVLQVSGQIATMPEKSKRPVRFANLAHLFAKISQQGSMLDELCEIAITHGRAIEAEFVALKKARKNKKKVQQHGCAIEQQQPTLGASTSSIISPPQELRQWHLSQQNGEASVVSNTTVWQGLIVELAAPHENTIVLDPDITKTKGRMRTRRKKLALEVH
ncbi:unnamed protein product [Miscanthus lutarioriparius]|uniref:FAR1 domain-containing protein n=1 Tax=Miscanthus lutarioriparius TaxID=422564 RepID=A0A811P4L2_9POAL|nr:unnamed protein product [Miscanthus lutarioriparius]